MPIRKKAIKSVKDPIIDLKINSIIQNLIKGTFYRPIKMRTIRCYTTFTNTTKTKILTKKGYLAYQKLSRLSTKICKLSDKLKDTYGITAGTDHPQCAEPSDPNIQAYFLLLN